MQRFKCWKKVDTDVFANKKDGRKLGLSYNAYADEYALLTDVWIDSGAGEKIRDVIAIKYHLKTKDEALSFMQKYMKDHDRC